MAIGRNRQDQISEDKEVIKHLDEYNYLRAKITSYGQNNPKVRKKWQFNSLMKYYGIKTIIETKSDIYNPYQKYNFTWARDTNKKKKLWPKQSKYFEIKDMKNGNLTV